MTNVHDKCLIFDWDSVFSLEGNYVPSHLLDTMQIQLTLQDTNQIVPIDPRVNLSAVDLDCYVQVDDVALELFYYPVDTMAVIAEREAAAALEKSGEAEYGMSILSKLISVYPGVVNSNTQTYNISIGGSIP